LPFPFPFFDAGGVVVEVGGATEAERVRLRVEEVERGFVDARTPSERRCFFFGAMVR
jgi:hypothetical protein